MSYTIIYVWEDLDAPEAEQKFGDHFSEAETLEQAFEETRRLRREKFGERSGWFISSGAQHI